MPEFPDITIYIESLQSFVGGRTLDRARLFSPFVLRSVDPPLQEVEGKKISGLRRIGKQIVWELEDEYFIVFHLMIAGRFHWKKPGAKPPGKIGLAAFDFSNGTLLLTEASTRKRASMYCVRGHSNLKQFDRGGIEVIDVTIDEFRSVLRSENHTLKRALTDPRLFSAIGNAY